ncbi:MAG: glycosyltransferase family 4 protein [Gemmatimonadales bacterium]
MPSNDTALAVTAVVASAQLGGTERVLLDFANRAFEHDIVLRVVTPARGPLVEILENIGVPTAVVPGPTLMLRGSQQAGKLWSLPPALFGILAWSRRLARHEFLRDADVVYSVAFKPHLALALARRHPVVWHLHEFPPQSTGRFWRALSRRVPDRLIANSAAVGRSWSNGGNRTRQGDRIVVIPNGVNLDRFRPADKTFWIHDKLGIPHDRRLVGMPAVFARWKGQVEVIKAFELVSEDIPDVHLVVVGGSIYDTVSERDYGRELAGQIADSNTGEWVVPTVKSEEVKSETSTGAQGNGKRETDYLLVPRVHLLPFQTKIERAYPEFDLVVHYSLRPEPFGRVIVEAMACGIPVLAADEGGPAEILGGGIGPRREAGWLVPPRDPHALARAFKTAMDLPREVIESIGEAGRRRAEDFYSWRHFAERVADALKTTVMP